MLTVSSIISFITLIIGFISKRLNIVDKKYIPLENLVIGLVSGFIIYLTELDLNLYSAISTGVIGSLSAGGLYDCMERKKDENES